MIAIQSPTDEATIEVLRRDLAARIADHLEASGESQSQAARRLGVHQPKLSLLVRGHTDSLSLEWLIKVGIRAGLSLKLSTGRSSRDAKVTVSPVQVATDASSGSAVAAAARASRLAAEARMTPEQRIEAFIQHNASLEALRRATRNARPAKSLERHVMKPAAEAGCSLPLLMRLLPILKEEEIEYLVIGSLALAVYATVRATLEIHALISVPPARWHQLASRLRSEGFAVDLRMGDESDSVRGMLEVIDDAGCRVDLLGGLKGLDPSVFDRARAYPVLGEPVRFVGAEDLIAMKCLARGPQDLLDARAILDAQEGSLNLDLVRSLTRRFGRDAVRALESLLSS